MPAGKHRLPLPQEGVCQRPRSPALRARRLWPGGTAVGGSPPKGFDLSPVPPPKAITPYYFTLPSTLINALFTTISRMTIGSPGVSPGKIARKGRLREPRACRSESAAGLGEVKSALSARIFFRPMSPVTSGVFSAAAKLYWQLRHQDAVKSTITVLPSPFARISESGENTCHTRTLPGWLRRLRRLRLFLESTGDLTLREADGMRQTRDIRRLPQWPGPQGAQPTCGAMRHSTAQAARKQLRQRQRPGRRKLRRESSGRAARQGARRSSQAAGIP